MNSPRRKAIINLETIFRAETLARVKDSGENLDMQDCSQRQSYDPNFNYFQKSEPMEYQEFSVILFIAWVYIHISAIHFHNLNFVSPQNNSGLNTKYQSHKNIYGKNQEILVIFCISSHS